MGVYKCDKILYFCLYNDFRKYNNNFFFIVLGLIIIREILKNRNIIIDVCVFCIRYVFYEDLCDIEEGLGEEVFVFIWEVLIVVRILI